MDHLDLTLYAGEIFGFLGHNGSGKTTTIRLLNGVLGISEGTARVLDLDPRKDGPRLRKRTGVLTETPALDEKLSARENLYTYATLYDVPADKIAPRITTLLHDFELHERADEPLGGYSRGMKQRLALARTLIHDPELIFLDEPTAGLDPVATRNVHQRIKNLSEQGTHTIFLCTHNLAEAQKLCSRVAVMEQGKLVAIGTPRELAQNLWKGIYLEIEMAAESAPQALEALHVHPTIRQVAWHDKPDPHGPPYATAWVPDREIIPTLVDTLTQAGGRIYRLTPQAPTLEDVYFALHERNGRQA